MQGCFATCDKQIHIKRWSPTTFSFPTLAHTARPAVKHAEPFHISNGNEASVGRALLPAGRIYAGRGGEASRGPAERRDKNGITIVIFSKVMLFRLTSKVNKLFKCQSYFKQCISLDQFNS